MHKLKSIVRCLAATVLGGAVLGGAFLPAAQAGNLFADDNSNTSLNNLALTTVPAVTLSGLLINCTSPLTSGGTGNCRASALYSDNGRKVVTPFWSSSDASIATVDASGKVTAHSVTSKSTVFITGSYAEGGVIKTSLGAVTVNPDGVPDVSVPPLSSATMACFFAWAETQYPELFPTGTGKVPTVTFGPYAYRNYPIDYTYLGFETLTNTVIYIGPFSGGTLLQLGEFSNVWAKPSGCK